jgi:hypothetical protein
MKGDWFVSKIMENAISIHNAPRWSRGTHVSEREGIFRDVDTQNTKVPSVALVLSYDLLEG